MLTSQKLMKSIVMRGLYLIHFILMTAVMSTVWLTIYAPSLEAQHVQTVCTAVFLCYLILSIFFYRTYSAYKIGMYRAGEQVRLTKDRKAYNILNVRCMGSVGYSARNPCAIAA